MEPIIIYGTAGLSLAVIGVGLAALRRSLPSQLVRQWKELRADVSLYRDEMDEHRSRMTAMRAEVEGVLESVDTVLGQVERKRRSIAGSESRMNRDAAQETPPEPEPEDDRISLERRARASGLLTLGAARN